jgi:Carboxypeptidase regulatory-like domain
MWSTPRRRLAVAVLIAVTGTVAPAAVDVGSVVGVVRSTGTATPRAPVAVTVDPAVCGETVADASLRIGDGGAVADAVVVLRGVAPPADPPSGEVLVDNAHCRFVPRVQIARRGQTVRVRNSDPVLHNAHPVLVAEPEASIANLALSRPGLTMDLTRRLAATLPASGEAFVRFGCDVHPWMRGWLVVLDHGFAAVTGADGAFTIAHVPPGTYTLAVWHETLGRLERPVTVRPGEPARLDVSFPARP